MVKIIIAGGRDFDDYQRINNLINSYKVGLKLAGKSVEIVSGGARGADKLGEEFAKKWWHKVKKFPADWDTHGKRAGPIRNIEMAKYADVLFAFWDGQSRGTEHMIEVALRHGLEVHVYRY